MDIELYYYYITVEGEIQAGKLRFGQKFGQHVNCYFPHPALSQRERV
jgi:hypothetical protein